MTSKQGKHTPRWTVEHDADGDYAIFDGNEVVAVTATDKAQELASATVLVRHANNSVALAEAVDSLLMHVRDRVPEKTGPARH